MPRVRHRHRNTSRRGQFHFRRPGDGGRADRLIFSVYDVAPTLLAGMGLLVARNLTHVPRPELFENSVTPRFVASFALTRTSGERTEEQDEAHIDQPTKE